MNAVQANLDVADMEIFFTDGAQSRTWGEAKLVVSSITQLFVDLKINRNDVVAIDSNKNFYTYAAILGCYVNGVAFTPMNFDEIDNSKCIPSVLNPRLYLSSSKKNIELECKFMVIEDVCNGYSPTKFIDYIFSPDGNETAYIMQSSGSTGIPKLIPISYLNLHNYLAAVENLVPLKKFSRFAQVSSLTFDLSMHDLFLSFSNFGALIPMQASLAKLAPRFINGLSVNYIMAVPSYYHQMTLLAEPMPSVNSVFLCGEALRRQVSEQVVNMFPNARAFNFYGPTEATIAISFYELPKEECENQNDIVSIGKALPGNNITLSEDNELLLGGNQLFNGYYKGSSPDRFVFIDCNRFYRSGDYCKVLDGNFYFLGRFDFQIKYRGYRIELEGLEANLGNKFNSNFAVIGYDQYAPSNFMGLAVFYDDVAISSKEILSALPPHLSGAKPIIIGEIPRNPSGKIDRRKLLDLT